LVDVSPGELAAKTTELTDLQGVLTQGKAESAAQSELVIALRRDLKQAQAELSKYDLALEAGRRARGTQSPVPSVPSRGSTRLPEVDAGIEAFRQQVNRVSVKLGTPDRQHRSPTSTNMLEWAVPSGSMLPSLSSLERHGSSPFNPVDPALTVRGSPLLGLLSPNNLGARALQAQLSEAERDLSAALSRESSLSEKAGGLQRRLEELTERLGEGLGGDGSLLVGRALVTSEAELEACQSRLSEVEEDLAVSTNRVEELEGDLSD